MSSLLTFDSIPVPIPYGLQQIMNRDMATISLDTYEDSYSPYPGLNITWDIEYPSFYGFIQGTYVSGYFSQMNTLSPNLMVRFNELLQQNFQTSVIIETLKQQIIPFIPKRSGRLLDTILNTLTFSTREGVTAHHTLIEISWDYPLGLNEAIPNSKHAPPQQGWAKTYIPINKEVITYPIDSDKGNTLYVLNDPQAVDSYDAFMRRTVNQLLPTIFDFQITLLVILGKMSNIVYHR